MDNELLPDRIRQAVARDEREHMKPNKKKNAWSKVKRLRCAIAAAPYCHARKGESNGKADKMNRATIAGAGKFAPLKPPLKLVK